MIRPIIRGLLSYVPGLLNLLKSGRGSKGTGGTNSARYCYSVWMRHLIELENSKKNKRCEIKTIAEFGPGDSLGIGLTAMLTGAEKYYALDVIEHANHSFNLKILDEIVGLLKKRTDIPGDEEFPLITPKLSDYRFPEKLFSKDELTELLSEDRINHIKNALINGKSKKYEIKYYVPWSRFQTDNLDLDIIISQAVLEHIDDLDSAYKAMNHWLVKDGVISHSVDYSAHETHKRWNGHWGYSSFLWKIILHGRSYSINRLPHSAHLELIDKYGFEIFNIKPTIDKNEISVNKIKKVVQLGNNQDCNIRNSFIQARKR